MRKTEIALITSVENAKKSECLAEEFGEEVRYINDLAYTHGLNIIEDVLRTRKLVEQELNNEKN